VLTALVRTLDAGVFTPFAQGSPRVPQLAADFLKDECAGAHGLPEDVKSKLRAISNNATQKSP
jgi:hypothetical protein